MGRIPWWPWIVALFVIVGAFLWSKGGYRNGSDSLPKEGNLVEMTDGEMKFPDGAIYRGEWEDGLPHGRGDWRFPGNGAGYVGEFKEGVYDGQGEEKSSDGSVYKGKFVSGRREGYGEEKYPDGSLYKGEWRNGEYHGQGEMIFADGTGYVGKFKNGISSGQGWLLQADGDLLMSGGPPPRAKGKGHKGKGRMMGGGKKRM